jgi:hypothetical protein
MTRPEAERDPYWQEDVAIGEGEFFRGESSTIRMRLHTAVERASRRHEIVPLSDAVRERVYVHGKPYILVPDITLSVGLYRQPDAGGAIGEVRGADWTGMRHEEIGQAQAWHYPADRLTVLWECFAEQRYRRADDPRRDTIQRTLWAGFETWLARRFPQTRQLVTTWEDLFDRSAWQAFLEERGYRRVAPAAYAKDLISATTPTPPHAPERP